MGSVAIVSIIFVSQRSQEANLVYRLEGLRFGSKPLWKTYFRAGHLVALPCVFIDIVGSSFIFNIFFPRRVLFLRLVTGLFSIR